MIDFPGCREMRYVALGVELGFFAVGRGGQRYYTKYSWANSLRDRLDGAAFAGGVAPFEDDDHSEARVYNPLLQQAQLGLQLSQLLLVGFALQLGFFISLLMLGHR